MSGNFAFFREVKARKQHRCQDCHRTITAGETYHRSAGSHYGDFWHWISCAHCEALRLIVGRIHPDFAYDEDGFNLPDWVSEYGSHPAEVHYLDKSNALSIYRWSKWFQGRWSDKNGVLRAVPRLTVNA